MFSTNNSEIRVAKSFKARSEEHTSELQSPCNLVCRLLLEKKNEAVRAGVAELSEPVVLVSHSGSGLLLPLIADALAQPVRGLIFVDSGLPAKEGQTRFMPPSSLERFRALAANGVLPPWSSWFGEEAMREVI